MTALLSTLANFTCVGIGDILLWTVQGYSLTDPSNQDREISVTTINISVDVWSSVLTIKAVPINDEIRVGCVVGSRTDNPVFKGAILSLRG